MTKQWIAILMLCAFAAACAAPAAEKRMTQDLTIEVHGLLAVREAEAEIDGKNEDVIYALMVDARDPKNSPPPCAHLPTDHDDFLRHYPKHTAAIVVRGASLVSNDPQAEPQVIDGKKIVLDGHDVRIDTSKATGLPQRDWSPLFDGPEFEKAGYKDKELPPLDAQEYLGDTFGPLGDHLVARVRFQEADSVRARDSTCNPLEMKRFAVNTGGLTCKEQRASEVAEQVDLVLSAVTEVKISLRKGSGSPVTYTATPTGSDSFAIAVRNIAVDHVDLEPLECPAGSRSHYASYRHFYSLVEDQEPDCEPIPCLVGEAANGFKCPIP